MSPVRIIQTFVRVCADCPNCTYYSGGIHRCTLTEEIIRPDEKPYKVGEHCPLPYAGPPTNPSPQSSQEGVKPFPMSVEDMVYMLEKYDLAIVAAAVDEALAKSKAGS